MGVADLPQPNSLPRREISGTQRKFAIGALLRSLLLILLLSTATGLMAYQAPPSGRVPIGWPGDRLFLDTSPGLGAEQVVQGDLFADELTPNAPAGRSRWTRAHAVLRLPNLGTGADLELTLTVQGWPDDVRAAPVAQPTVTVQADGTAIGTFTPTSAWGQYTLRIPAQIRSGADLHLDLYTSHVFTDTQTFQGDPRPKGVRLAELTVRAPTANPAALYPPAWSAIGLLVVNAILLFLLIGRLIRPAPVVYTLTAIGVGLAGVGLATVRIWMGAALNVALLALVVALILAYHGPLLATVRALLHRYTLGGALGYSLVAVALGLFGYSVAQLVAWIANPAGHCLS
ncbi:MAG: hypothetical protein HC822_26865 [Oscillochloris sp.]|nr:hypothetical protein [Oscillochloris sp.]